MLQQPRVAWLSRGTAGNPCASLCPLDIVAQKPLQVRPQHGSCSKTLRVYQRAHQRPCWSMPTRGPAARQPSGSAPGLGLRQPPSACSTCPKPPRNPKGDHPSFKYLGLLSGIMAMSAGVGELF